MNNNENTIAITLGASQTSAQPTAISLGNYADGDLITKKELGKCLRCSERTLQRMVERFELPRQCRLLAAKSGLSANSVHGSPKPPNAGKRRH